MTTHQVPDNQDARPRPVRPAWPCLLSGPIRCLPDFLVIGAQKSGTSSLAAYLHEHPAAWIAPCKECHFFSRPWRPLSMYRGFFPTRSARRRMEVERGHPVQLGEATPYYLFHPMAPDRVARSLPRARIIVLLRDPVERAWSHYRHSVRLGYESLDFDEALAREPERLEGQEDKLIQSRFAVSHPHRDFSYVARGHYANQLNRWFSVIDRSRVHVEIAEDLFRDPTGATARIEQFLGLPAGPTREFDVLNKGLQMAPMSDSTRKRLSDTFSTSNQELATLLDRDLPWPG
ncbi:MAG: sulfotransferase domain-containing protein [Phycisphaerales bacterium]|nr:sulfotransferase domain-containing protein [Phycisphaerales bacterium]